LVKSGDRGAFIGQDRRQCVLVLPVADFAAMIGASLERLKLRVAALEKNVLDRSSSKRCSCCRQVGPRNISK
jgi:hypothetical protein